MATGVSYSSSSIPALQPLQSKDDILSHLKNLGGHLKNLGGHLKNLGGHLKDLGGHLKDLEEVKTLLQQLKQHDGNINALSPVLFSFFRSNYDQSFILPLLELCIAEGLDVNATDPESGDTLLHRACSASTYYEVVTLLLLHRAQLMQNKLGVTPLLLAATLPSINTMNLLLSQPTARAYIDSFNEHLLLKTNPLLSALKNKNYEMVELLLNSGANPHIEEEENTPLEWALEHCQEGNDRNLRDLLISHSPHVPHRNAFLARVVTASDVQQLQKLFTLGVSPNCYEHGAFKIPVLTKAAECSLPCFNLFLKNPQTDVNMRTQRGRTTLICLLENIDQEKNLDRVFLLLKHKKTDVNALNLEGDSALTLLLKNPYVPHGIQATLVKALLDKGAQTDIVVQNHSVTDLAHRTNNSEVIALVHPPALPASAPSPPSTALPSIPLPEDESRYFSSSSSSYSSSSSSCSSLSTSSSISSTSSTMRVSEPISSAILYIEGILLLGSLVLSAYLSAWILILSAVLVGAIAYQYAHCF